MHCPTTEHRVAVKLLLRYIKHTLNHSLTISKSPHYSLSIYLNANWMRFIDDRRSTSGYFIFFGFNLISQNSRKQPTVAQSNTELEYKVVANAIAEACWVTTLLGELGVSLPGAPTLWCDNVGDIYLTAKNQPRSFLMYILYPPLISQQTYSQRFQVYLDSHYYGPSSTSLTGFFCGGCQK